VPPRPQTLRWALRQTRSSSRQSAGHVPVYIPEEAH
jgi:hypothetical protein